MGLERGGGLGGGIFERRGREGSVNGREAA